MALPPEVSPGTPSTNTLEIVDGGTFSIGEHVVSFSRSKISVADHANDVSVSVLINPAPTTALTIPIVRVAGTAEKTDCVLPDPSAVVFGVDELRRDFVVTILDDKVLEPLVLGFGDPLLSNVVEGTSVASVAITDNDFEVSFVHQTVEVNEDEGSVEVLVSISPAPTAAVGVLVIPIVEVRGSAGGLDFRLSGPKNVTFRAGDALVQSFLIEVLDDDRYEIRETVVLGFGHISSPNVSIAEPPTSQLEIIDDDQAPVYEVKFDPSHRTSPVEEDSSAVATMGVLIDAAPIPIIGPLTIPIIVVGGSADHTDFTLKNSSVTFQAGRVLRQEFSVEIHDDDVAEHDEEILFGFGDLPQHVRMDVNFREGVMTITDDDAHVPMNNRVSGFLDGIIVVDEGAGTAYVPVGMRAPTNDTGPITLPIEVTSTTAGDDDFKLPATSSISFAIGQYFKDFEIEIVDDDIFEAAEQVVNEGDGTVVIGVSIDPVPIVVLAGSTASGRDYALPDPSAVVFDVDDSQEDFVITIRNNDAGEYDEVILLGLVDPLPGNLMAGDPSVSKVTINDDDPRSTSPPVTPLATYTVFFSVVAKTVDEKVGHVELGAWISPIPEIAIAIPIVADDTVVGAASVSDYRLPSPFFVQFDKTTDTAAFTVEIVDDSLVEGNEVIVLIFGSLPPDVMVGTQDMLTVAIEDDDALVVSFDDAVLYAAEDVGSVMVGFSVSSAHAAAIDIPIVVSGNATASTSDYTLSAEVVSSSGTLTASLVVEVEDDAEVEGPETIMRRCH